MKYIIVGGVAGGATAAARIRRIDESAEIILLEKDKYISYANCGLPYYIGGIIEDRGRLFLQTKESFAKRFKVDVRVGNEVIKINPEFKEIVIYDENRKQYIEKFDKLLLSPGAYPVIPSLPGIGLEGIFTLRNINDTDKIKNFISTGKIDKVLIVGGGFIGLEIAENLHNHVAEVNVIEIGNQVMANIDYSMAAVIHQHLVQKGINLHLEKAVLSFERNDDRIEVTLSGGETIIVDLVIVSAGVKPATVLAEKAGLKIGETGGIWVSEYLETSEKDIYAVGDAIEFPHPLTGKPWLIFSSECGKSSGTVSCR